MEETKSAHLKLDPSFEPWILMMEVQMLRGTAIQTFCSGNSWRQETNHCAMTAIGENAILLGYVETNDYVGGGGVVSMKHALIFCRGDVWMVPYISPRALKNGSLCL